MADGNRSDSSTNGGTAYRRPVLPNLMNGVDPRQRLPSFKRDRPNDDAAVSRDQLLQKAKEPVRKFMPKLKQKAKVVAKKSAAPEQPPPVVTKKDRPSRKPDAQKPKFKPRETIQTSGSVFDTSTQFDKKVRSSYGDGESRSAGRSTTVALSESERAKRQKKRDELQASAKEGYVSEEYDEDEEDNDISPLTLPMLKTLSLSSKNVRKVEVKPILHSKTSLSSPSLNGFHATEEDIKPDVAKPFSNVDPFCREPCDLRNFVNSVLCPADDSEELFTMQFPDFIPVSEKMMRMKNSAVDEEEAKPQQEGDAASGFEEQSVGAYKLTLRDLPEGLFCRFRVRQSGKAELVFPSGIVFPVIKGCGIGFRQDICVIDKGDEERRGKLSVIGSLKEKLLCVPDFEPLFESSEAHRNASVISKMRKS